MKGGDIGLEQVLAEKAWLRRLAARLAGDDADDLVQETRIAHRRDLRGRRRCGGRPARRRRDRGGGRHRRRHRRRAAFVLIAGHPAGTTVEILTQRGVARVTLR